MKFLAAILAVLILTLTAGVNSGYASVAQAETADAGCGCCCRCANPDNDSATEQQQDAAPEGKCPFCPANNSPAFTATFPAHYPVCLTEIVHKGNIFIIRKYNAPLTKGIWQPPRF